VGDLLGVEVRERSRGDGAESGEAEREDEGLPFQFFHKIYSSQSAISNVV